METRQRTGGLVGPLILVAVGVIFLLSNLGLLGWSAWELILRFWPVILIAVGLEVLIGRHSLVGSLITLVVVIAMVGALLWLVPVRAVVGTAVSTETISQPLDGARRANVEISFGAGNVRIGALSDSELLIQGTALADEGTRLEQSFQVSGDTANYRLRTHSVGPGQFWLQSGGQNWDLKLNGDVPIDLKLNGGVGTSDLDLSQLTLSGLDANLGVGRTTITFPATGQLRAIIDGGVGEATLVVPRGVAVRAEVDAGIGGVSVPPEYRKEGDVYISPDYPGSENRLDLAVNGGVGRIEIRQ